MRQRKTKRWRLGQIWTLTEEELWRKIWKRPRMPKGYRLTKACVLELITLTQCTQLEQMEQMTPNPAHR